MTNIWNKNPIITPVSEYQLIYHYQQHKQQVQSIRHQSPNLEKPFIKKKTKQIKSNKLLEIRHPEKLENKVLIDKLIKINHEPSIYAKDVISTSIKRPTNIGQRIIEMKQLIEDNESIEDRLKKTTSVIQFSKMKQEYKQNKKYLKNLSQNSRRIYNCFVSPVEEIKKKKKSQKHRLSNTGDQQNRLDIDQQQPKEVYQIKIADTKHDKYSIDEIPVEQSKIQKNQQLTALDQEQLMEKLERLQFDQDK